MNKKVVEVITTPTPKMYTEEEVMNIARQAWNMGKEVATGTDDFPMAGYFFSYPTFEEWFKEQKF